MGGGMFTKKNLSRRTLLQGFGAFLALPLLESMAPAQTLRRKSKRPKPRLVAIEMVHGDAGSTPLGRERHYWSPAQVGKDFQFTPTLKPLEPLREYVSVVSNTELRNAMSLVPEEDGPMADHARSSAVFLTAAHPKMTVESDVEAGPSFDQIYAQHCAEDTRIASLQICIEDLNLLSGVCGHRYSCAYTNTISWAGPTKPLLMERAPRTIFERLFGDGATEEALKRKNGNRSVLDGSRENVARLQRLLGTSDRQRVNEFLDYARAVESRIQLIEQRNLNSIDRELANAPLSVPDSFDEHVDVMFDLQVLAFMADITRVSSFKMGLDRSPRVYPASGVSTPFHALSHHRETPEKIEEFSRLNRYHVSKVASFLERLRKTPDGDGSLLDHSVVVYGSPMGDSHIHEHKFLPLFLAGHANGLLHGNTHVRCDPETPMANVWLTLLRKLGVNLERIGDSTGEIAI